MDTLKEQPRHESAGFSNGDPDYLCACREVPRQRVDMLIKEQGIRRIEEIRRLTGAGTGCGTCRILIARRIRELLGVEPDYSSEEESGGSGLGFPLE